ncbi:P2X purinoceptor 4-like [Hydractinia symbiolongicarpus]|uniref:P2X purinoceptor 4-like n=1 Tax=Hydractinia symbiolongicarpus TaxID=13093 RepID=UPI0025500BCB|nr:P2X purinoceptor 4-like [Hydractinia symbiolongicarpus]
MAAGGKLENFLAIILHYETVKIVDIKNKKVGALYRFIQLVILAYIIGYVIVYKKGYQEVSDCISSVSTKLKGTAYVDFKDFYSPLFQGIQVYDPADYVIPAQENNAFFVMTNMIITPNQTQSKCPEDPKFKDNLCTTKDDCEALVPVKNGNGVRTGECVKSDRNSSIHVCEIYGWCPTEIDELPMPGYNFSHSIPLLDLAKDFTVLLKNQVSFPKFDVQRRNIITHNNSNYLKNCTHGPDNRLCPIFKLSDIVSACGENFTHVAYQGASFGIIVNWDCNLDHSIDSCLPSYRFKRLDDPTVPIAPGYNFRYAQHYVQNNSRYRILTKAYGLKFEILVHGKAGKFSPVPLFTNLGAGLALLGIASIWCDFIVMYLLKKRKVYKEHKYLKIEDDTPVHSEDEYDVHEERKPLTLED